MSSCLPKIKLCIGKRLKLMFATGKIPIVTPHLFLFIHKLLRAPCWTMGVPSRIEIDLPCLATNWKSFAPPSDNCSWAYDVHSRLRLFMWSFMTYLWIWTIVFVTWDKDIRCRIYLRAAACKEYSPQQRSSWRSLSSATRLQSPLPACRRPLCQ